MKPQSSASNSISCTSCPSKSLLRPSGGSLRKLKPCSTVVALLIPRRSSQGQVALHARALQAGAGCRRRGLQPHRHSGVPLSALPGARALKGRRPAYHAWRLRQPPDLKVKPASNACKSSTQQANAAENWQGRDGSGIGKGGEGVKLFFLNSTLGKVLAHSCIIG